MKTVGQRLTQEPVTTCLTWGNLSRAFFKVWFTVFLNWELASDVWLKHLQLKLGSATAPPPFLLGSYRKLSWLKCLELLQNKLQELVYRLQKWLQENYVDALKVLYNKGCGVYWKSYGARRRNRTADTRIFNYMPCLFCNPHELTLSG